jgi:hypothetical protein
LLIHVSVKKRRVKKRRVKEGLGAREHIVIGGSGIEEGKGNRVFVLGRRKGW